MGYLRNRWAEPSTKNALAIGFTIASQFLPTWSPLLLGIAAVLAGKTAATPG